MLSLLAWWIEVNKVNLHHHYWEHAFHTVRKPINLWSKIRRALFSILEGICDSPYDTQHCKKCQSDLSTSHQVPEQTSLDSSTKWRRFRWAEDSKEEERAEAFQEGDEDEVSHMEMVLQWLIGVEGVHYSSGSDSCNYDANTGYRHDHEPESGGEDDPLATA